MVVPPLGRLREFDSPDLGEGDVLGGGPSGPDVVRHRGRTALSVAQSILLRVLAN